MNIQLTGIPAALLISAILLGLTITWILIDPAFPSTVELSLIDLRLQEHPGLKQSIMDEVHDELRWRMWMLGIISCLVVLSSALIVLRLTAGSPADRSIAAMLMVTSLVAAWLCLYTQYNWLAEYAIEWRIKRQIPQLKLLAERLATNWPNEDIEIEGFGKFGFDPQSPNILMALDEDSQPFVEKLGHFVRNHEGVVIFEFAESHDKPFFVEFHQPESEPRSFQEAFPNFINKYHLVETESVANGVFLSRYSQTTQFFDEELQKLFDE
jgi:hypothetical protein